MPAKKIKRPGFYWGCFFEKAISYGLITGYSIFMDHFFHSIANSKHISSFTEERVDACLSNFALSYYAGAAVGTVTSALLVDIDSKPLYNGMKILLAFSSFSFTIGDFWVMLISRFFHGFCFQVIMIVIYWYCYQSFIEEHIQMSYNAIMAGQSFNYMLILFLGKSDDRTYWYWRSVMILMGITCLIMAAVDDLYFREMNTLRYLVAMKTKAEAIEALSFYLETGEALKQINSYMKCLDERDFQNKLTLNRLIKKATYYSYELKHVILFCVLALLSCPEIYFSHSLYLSNISFKDYENVIQEKFYLKEGAVFKFLFSVFLVVFAINKNAKLAFLYVHSWLTFCLFIVAYGYLIHDLNITHYFMLVALPCEPLFYSTFWVYTSDFLQPSLETIAYMIVNVFIPGLNFFITYFVHYNILQQYYMVIAYKLMFFVALGVASNFWLRLMMIDTERLSKSKLYNILRGKSQGKIEELELLD